MKITESTDRRLVVEHRPWFFCGMLWLMGLTALYSAVTGASISGWAERLLVLVLGLGTCFAAWYWFAFLRITFDRDRGQVEHLALRPFGSQWKCLDLAKVRRARLEADWSDGARLTGLVLDTEDGPAKLEYGYTSTDRTQIEAAINAWLESRRGRDA